MKITGWQMFVAWLKQRDLLTWYLLLVALLSNSLEHRVTAYSIICIVVQLLLTVLFLRYSIKEVFPKSTSNKMIVASIILILFAVICIDISTYIFAKNFIQFFLVIFHAVVYIPFLYIYVKITHDNYTK